MRPVTPRPHRHRCNAGTRSAIETPASALDPAATTRRRAQAWLQWRGYEPTTLHLGPVTRLGARATAASIAFDNHPNDMRFSDHVGTVTVAPAFVWLQRTLLGTAPITVHSGAKLPATVAPKPEFRAPPELRDPAR